MDEETAGQRDLGGQARAFGVDGVFDDLNQDGLTFKEHVFDALGFVRIAALFEDVDDMQKRGTFQADIDKRTLHAGKDAFDDTQINIADQAMAAIAFDVQFADIVLFQNGHTRFLRRNVDEDGFGRTHGVLGDGNS